MMNGPSFNGVINDNFHFRATMAMMNGAVMGKQAQQPPPPPKPGGIEDLAQVTNKPSRTDFSFTLPTTYLIVKTKGNYFTLKLSCGSFSSFY